MAILSIQSHVAYGHVGNRAAVFPLELLGHDVWPINTVQFSNHRGYPSCSGETFTGAHIELVWDGIKALGLLPECEAVLSGYLGSVGVGAAVLSAVADVKSLRPEAIYCCDPVIGDYGTGLYVEDEIADFFAGSALGWADIVTPNQFEAERLSGRVIDSIASAASACDAIRAQGPKIVLITGFKPAQERDSAVSFFLASGDGFHMITTPELPLDPVPHGAGDLCAALFLGHYLICRDPVEALELCCPTVFAVIERSHAARSPELLIAQSREDILAPHRRFSARKVS